MDSLRTGTKTASLPEIWAALRSTESTEVAGDLRLRLCHEAPDVRVFGAVAGARKEAAIVIEIAADLLPREIRAASGRRLELIAAELPGLPPGRGAVVVQLRDEQFEDLFEQFGACLVDEVRSQDTAAAAVHSAVRQIERWRRFLERRREILSAEEVRGLIGELAVLERLMSRISPNAGLTSWKSPQRSIRDFECPDVAVEVKTYMSSSGASVRISDPLQLEPEPGIPLLLACLELSRTPKTNCTLTDHIARVSRLLVHDRALLEDFENALALSGFLPVHADLYSDGYVIGATHVFRVGDEFPRIRPGDVPAHVACVQFSLEVLPLLRFAVDLDTWIGGEVREAVDE
jgi:hypothetical protein